MEIRKVISDEFEVWLNGYEDKRCSYWRVAIHGLPGKYVCFDYVVNHKTLGMEDNNEYIPFTVALENVKEWARTQKNSSIIEMIIQEIPYVHLLRLAQNLSDKANN